MEWRKKYTETLDLLHWPLSSPDPCLRTTTLEENPGANTAEHIIQLKFRAVLLQARERERKKKKMEKKNRLKMNNQTEQWVKRFSEPDTKKSRFKM